MTELARVHVSVNEAARVLGVCRSTLYNMQRDGEIRFTKLRRRTFVGVAEIERVRRTLAGEAAIAADAPRRPSKRQLQPARG